MKSLGVKNFLMTKVFPKKIYLFITIFFLLGITTFLIIYFATDLIKGKKTSSGKEPTSSPHHGPTPKPTHHSDPHPHPGPTPKPTHQPTPGPPPPLPSTGDFAALINPILKLNGITNPQNDLLFNSQQYSWDSFTKAVDYWNHWANSKSDPYRPAYCTFLSQESCTESTSGIPGCPAGKTVTYTKNQIIQELCSIFANAMVETDGFKACKEYLGCTQDLGDIEGVTWTVGGEKYTTSNYPDPLQGTCSQKKGDKVNCAAWTAKYGSGPGPDPSTKTSKSCGGDICLYLNPPPPNPEPGTYTSCGGVHGYMKGAQYDYSGNAGCAGGRGGPTQIGCPEPPVECSDFMGNLAQRDLSKSLEVQKAGMAKVGCFYGRGLAQLTTPCNYGAMSYYTKGMPYMQRQMKSFCSHPDVLCQDQIAGWIGNIWYWIALVKKGWIKNKRCFGTSTANYHPSGGGGAHINTKVNPPITHGTRAQWYAWFLLFKFPKAADGNGWDLRLKNKTDGKVIKVDANTFSTIDWTNEGDFLYVSDGEPPTACGGTQSYGCVALGGGHQPGFCCPKGFDCNDISDPSKVISTCSLGWCSSNEHNCGLCGANSRKWCPNNTDVYDTHYQGIHHDYQHLFNKLKSIF